MLQSQITPGPWYEYGPFIIATDTFGILSDIYIAQIIEDDAEGRVACCEQRAANRHMIAALPDLLCAAEEAVRYWSSDSAGCYDALERAMRKLELAISYAGAKT